MAVRGKAERNRGITPFPLREMLDVRGWTQGRLSRETGIAREHISRLISGVRTPAWPTLLRICGAMGLSVPDLLLTGDV